MSHETRLAKGPDIHRSRAFLFGESIFTTLKVFEGKLCFAQAHLKRLQEGAEWIWPGTASQVLDLWNQLSPPTGTGVWRLTLSSLQTDRQVRLSEAPQLFLDCWWHEGDLPKTQGDACLVPTVSRPEDWPSFLKTGDYLTRLVAARKIKPEEIPLYVVHGEVCEFLHANFIGWDGECFHTPSLSPNVLAGIGRERFLEIARLKKIDVRERKILDEEISNFKAVAAVNAVRGIIPMRSIDGRPLLGHSIFEPWNEPDFFMRDL